MTKKINFQFVFREIRRWIKDNKKEAIIIFVILIIGSILRLYRISEFMTFLGDEGRDAIIVRRLLVNFDPILIGPGTSVGNMYLGPLYYYLIAPSLLLFFFNPAGPSVFVALLGITTIFLIWLFFREWFPSKNGNTFNIGALIAAGLYAISPTVIIYSRSSWNPNVMPFFALICIYSIWRVWYDKRFIWLIVSAISFAFVMQSHYLGLLLLPVFGVFYILTLLSISFTGMTYRNKKEKVSYKNARRSLFKYSLLSFGLFIFLMSPLVIFDARHGWRNFASIRKFFTERQTTVSIKPWKALPGLDEIFTQVTGSLMAVKKETLGLMATFVLTVGILYLFYILYKSKFKDKLTWPTILMFTWLFSGLIGLALYKQHIYDHYFGFFLPVVFILLGLLVQTAYEKSKMIFCLLSLFVACLIYVNLSNNPIKGSPNRQMQRAQSVANFIKDNSGGQKLNLAVIAERNYEDGYQYFLEKDRVSVYDIDPLKLNDTIADQLFVVCEMPKEKCDPTHSPKAEVANFGWSKIDREWEVAGVTVYKLVHSQ